MQQLVARNDKLNVRIKEIEAQLAKMDDDRDLNGAKTDWDLVDALEAEQHALTSEVTQNSLRVNDLFHAARQ
jgi:predicted nucleic acid-binding protein